jgi:glycosyltransferase involved in cell wall biosynthesis
MRYRLEHDPDADAPAHQVLYNPVDTDFYAGACPDRGPEGFAAPVLGRLSRADPGKWSPLGYEIIPILAREVPGFRYRVVGATPEVEAWVAARGLASCVEFLPPLSSEAELADFFNSLTALAHACDTGESFGLAIAEAMAAGLPVVTHPSPWPRDNAQVELVEHEVTGLVARGTEAYARACLSLLSDRDKAWTLGRAGREKAGRCYRVQDVARRLEDIYTDLLAGRKAGT